MHFWEPPSLSRQLLVLSLSRQLLVRVVNHTLLLMRSVSWFSTQRSVHWGQTLTVALLRTTELFPAVTRARSKSHTTPNTECVTILYKKISSVRSNPHSRTFENLRVFPRQLLVCVVNHTLLLIQSVSRFSAQYQFSEVKPSHTSFWEPSSLSRQLLLCVVNHTLLLIRSVSRFSTKYQFSEVKPSQSHFWEP